MLEEDHLPGGEVLTYSPGDDERERWVNAPSLLKSPWLSRFAISCSKTGNQSATRESLFHQILQVRLFGKPIGEYPKAALRHYAAAPGPTMP